METKDLILQGVRWIAAEGMNAANNKPGKVRVGYGNTQACAVCGVALSEAPPQRVEGFLSHSWRSGLYRHRVSGARWKDGDESIFYSWRNG